MTLERSGDVSSWHSASNTCQPIAFGYGTSSLASRSLINHERPDCNSRYNVTTWLSTFCVHNADACPRMRPADVTTGRYGESNFTRHRKLADGVAESLPPPIT